MTFPTKEDMTAKNILMYSCLALFGLLALNIVLKLLPVAILLFFLLAPPIFVLSDAQERKTDRPVLWGVFTLFTSVFGLVVYLLVRPEKATNRICNHCRGKVEDGFVACPWCGRPIEKIVTKCPKCASDIKDGWKFCPKCQAEIKTVDSAKNEEKSEESKENLPTAI